MLCKPKSFYDEANKVAIGYKNPLYLSKAKRVQLALYSGQEIIKTNHDHVVVHDSKDTLEIVETTRKQMNEKMNDPMCVKKKVKIAPPDYSKENYLATFTPQKQFTPKQTFWSGDILKMKAKALKEKAKSAKPITAMMVYPPNTPAKLVPKVLPTKIQVQAEMDQHAVDKKCDEIERKNLLIENENLIADYLSKEIQNDDHDEMIKHSSKLEVEHLNLQLKYQHLKERRGNKKSVTSSDAPAFDSVFVIGNLTKQLQGKGNTIRELKETISQLRKKHSEADPILDFKALDFQNKDLTAKIAVCLVLNSGKPLRDNMANENVLAPALTRFDDQILPFNACVPIGKSNYVLDLQKKQRNPIFQISVDILQNTNFFRAFTASAFVPAIYIQQFWNTLTYKAKTGAYSFQLDEK
ncbi:hypothetical protein Tco_1106898 [Tanacetum coccineum]